MVPGRSLGHVAVTVGRATATAFGHHRILDLDPLAHPAAAAAGHRRSGPRLTSGSADDDLTRRLGAGLQAVVPLQGGGRGRRARAAVPPQQRLVLAAGGPAVHAGRHRARLLALDAVALQQPPGPEPLAQVLPPALHRAHGPAPQVLLDLPAQLAGYPGPQPPAVRQREVFRVERAHLGGHLAGGHQPSAAIPPAGAKMHDKRANAVERAERGGIEKFPRL